MGNMLTYRQGRLFLREHSVGDLAGEYQTPFLLIDEQRIRDNCSALGRGLAVGGSTVRLRYCAKANNEAGVLQLTADCGLDVLVSHAAEAELAVRCGFAPSQIAYQRPVVLETEVEQVLALGVRFFHAYQLEGVKALERIAGRHRIQITISPRLRKERTLLSLSPLGFLSRRHGLPPDDLRAAVRRVLDGRWTKLGGVNFYLGPHQKSYRSYISRLQQTADLANWIEGEFGVGFPEINLGGGIPSPSMKKGLLRWRPPRLDLLNDGPSRLEAFAGALGRVFHSTVASRLRKQPVLCAEPGRSAVGSAGLLVTRVLAVAGRWVFLDASRNFLGENPLFFSRLVLPVRCREGAPEGRFHLSGSTLNTMDFIDLARVLPRPEVGDLLVLADAGAYSISRANRYAGLPPAVYCLYTDGSVRMIREAESAGEMTAAMKVPSG